MSWYIACGQFKLEYWGSGLAYAYTLTHKPTNMQVYMQGDDAVLFERELAYAENAFPNKPYDEILAWLWDQHDYGKAAVYKGDVT